MNDELSNAYELLGVAPGTTGRELKQAYHDMAKVWHPDRFSHDPRLQQKAQEKLKEINEAYELLTSGRAARTARTTPPTRASYEPPVVPARRKRPQFILPVAVIFCAVFVAALIFLSPSDVPRPRAQTQTDEQQAAQPLKEGAQPGGEARPSSNQSVRNGERAERLTSTEATTGPAPDAQQLRAVPTVTVNIDAATGLLATRDCPDVSRMTFPSGAEPRRHCTTTHKAKEKDSRLKSVAKRVVTPSKWLGDGKGTPNEGARDAQPPGADRPQNR
ncbi:MAG TPA: J domain-containing protein [Pyrinomonadaceae bacterium]